MLIAARLLGDGINLRPVPSVRISKFFAIGLASNLPYSRYLDAREETFLLVGYCLAGIFATTLLLQASITLTLILTGLTAMLAIEAIGIAACLGLPLNTFATTIVVLTVGLGVDYDAHIGHHFLLQSGDSTTERVGHTMRYIGSAVFHAATSTLLGLAVASASNTEVVR
jgi:Niemann-Pick C1 protein